MVAAGDEEYAHDLLRHWGIEDYVEFHGATTGEAKRQAFVEADIFVFPTFFPVETFGIVNIEALEAGLPVITTPVAAIPEIIKDGINGYLVHLKRPCACGKNNLSRRSSGSSLPDGQAEPSNLSRGLQVTRLRRDG